MLLDLVWWTGTAALLRRLRLAPATGAASAALPDPPRRPHRHRARPGAPQLGAGPGADDHLTKPFDVDIWTRWLRPVTARGGAGVAPSAWRHRLDPATRTVRQHEQAGEMSPARVFGAAGAAGGARYVLSRQQIERLMYSWDAAIESNAVGCTSTTCGRKLGQRRSAPCGRWAISSPGKTCDAPRFRPVSALRFAHPAAVAVVPGALAIVWGSFVCSWGYQTGVHEADELTDGHLASVASLLLNLRATEFVEGLSGPSAPRPGSSRTTTSNHERGAVGAQKARGVPAGSAPSHVQRDRRVC